MKLRFAEDVPGPKKLLPIQNNRYGTDTMAGHGQAKVSSQGWGGAKVSSEGWGGARIRQLALWGIGMGRDMDDSWHCGGYGEQPHESATSACSQVQPPSFQMTRLRSLSMKLSQNGPFISTYF